MWLMRWLWEKIKHLLRALLRQQEDLPVQGENTLENIHVPTTLEPSQEQDQPVGEVRIVLDTEANVSHEATPITEEAQEDTCLELEQEQERGSSVDSQDSNDEIELSLEESGKKGGDDRQNQNHNQNQNEFLGTPGEAEDSREEDSLSESLIEDDFSLDKAEGFTSVFEASKNDSATETPERKKAKVTKEAVTPQQSPRVEAPFSTPQGDTRQLNRRASSALTPIAESSIMSVSETPKTISGEAVEKPVNAPGLVTPSDPRYRRLHDPEEPIAVDSRTFSARLNSAMKREERKKRGTKKDLMNAKFMTSQVGALDFSAHSPVPKGNKENSDPNL